MRMINRVSRSLGHFGWGFKGTKGFESFTTAAVTGLAWRQNTNNNSDLYCWGGLVSWPTVPL